MASFQIITGTPGILPPVMDEQWLTPGVTIEYTGSVKYDGNRDGGLDWTLISYNETFAHVNVTVWYKRRIWYNYYWYYYEYWNVIFTNQSTRQNGLWCFNLGAPIMAEPRLGNSHNASWGTEITIHELKEQRALKASLDGGEISLESNYDTTCGLAIDIKLQYNYPIGTTYQKTVEVTLHDAPFSLGLTPSIELLNLQIAAGEIIIAALFAFIWWGYPRLRKKNHEPKQNETR